ncbi:hypothetical protein [Arthrobacter ginkgonis]
MVDIALSVVPEPEEGTASIIAIENLVPAFVGKGEVNLNCGECGFRVAEGLEQASQLQSLVLICPRCKSHLASRL